MNLQRAVNFSDHHECGNETASWPPHRSFFGYRKGEGGFTGWLSRRLPHVAERWAFRAIEIYRGIDPALSAQWANISTKALAEVAKAGPDVQARMLPMLADEYDAAQERGEVAGPTGNHLRSDAERKPTAADIGLSRKDVHESRLIRDAKKRSSRERFQCRPRLVLDAGYQKRRRLC